VRNVKNPEYSGTYVFNNDFAALGMDVPASSSTDGLLRIQSVTGETRVICFSADHSKTMPELEPADVCMLIDTWAAQIDELSRDFSWVQVFENKGAMMGSSQAHPHNQVWASSFVPNEIAIRDQHLSNYFESNGSNLLLDYISHELKDGHRVVFENESWVALVPFWAAWPFETMLLPKAHRFAFDALTALEREQLGAALTELTSRYDNLFECSFPYSMGWHYAPTHAANSHWQLYAVFYPPLLRSATVRKFMVGYEMLAEIQRDITPEQAAEKLRGVSPVHYKNREG
jgi:UDPglucose--hexose-1-phosphate uridylyltransferase